MSTIIKRAVDALRATNKPYDDQLADELLTFATGLKDTTERLIENYKKQVFTMKQLISVWQSRCRHGQWYLMNSNNEGDPSTWGPQDTIACFECGHTVCDERAYAFGKRVRQGDYAIYAIANGRRFQLSPQLRKQLTDKLNVKEIKGEYSEERAGEIGQGTGGQ